MPQNQAAKHHEDASKSHAKASEHYGNAAKHTKEGQHEKAAHQSKLGDAHADTGREQSTHAKKKYNEAFGDKK